MKILKSAQTALILVFIGSEIVLAEILEINICETSHRDQWSSLRPLCYEEHVLATRPTASGDNSMEKLHMILS